MLSLKLFGSGQGWYDDRPLAGFPCQHPGLLLCYLVLNRRLPHQRDRLAAVFWGDHTSHDARKCLRHVLWRLRQTLEAAGAQPDLYLSIGEDVVEFLPAAPYLLDTEVFETALARHQGISAERCTAEQANCIQKAVDLYTGDLLERVDADWCLYDREHMRLMYLNALDKLMVYHGLQGNFEGGLAYGERILAYDSTREKIHQRMMWLHWVSGNRCAAIAQYRLCVRTLREEMGIDPMKQTQQLYRRICHDEPSPTSQPAADELALSPSESDSQNPPAPLVDELLRHIHHLQAVVEQSDRELRSLERLLNRYCSNQAHTERDTWGPSV